MQKSTTVGIVIVSHSSLIAEGTADLVRQMVGDCIPLGWCGGNLEGGLGSDVESIEKAINAAWSDKGVAVFVDLGSTELNSEIAIENLPREKADKVKLMDAPLVEGAIIAAASASTLASLEDIQQAIKDLHL